MTDTFHAQKKQAADSRGIPADCIRLSDAFRTFVRTLMPLTHCGTTPYRDCVRLIFQLLNGLVRATKSFAELAPEPR